MENLNAILASIAEDYENASRGTTAEEDQEGDSVVSEGPECFDEPFENNYSAEDRWFIFCARPHGTVSLIPTFLSVAGFCCAVIGNNMCSLFFRKVLDGGVYYSSGLTNGTVTEVKGFSLGLYAYGVEYYRADDHVLHCSPTISEDVTTDIYIGLARGFSAVGAIVGFVILCLLSLSNCMMLSQKLFRLIAVALFITACCQALMFLYLLSGKCHDDLFVHLGQEEVDLEPCQLHHGSRMSISACLLWFVASVFTSLLDQASLVEERMKYLSMHARTLMNE